MRAASENRWLCLEQSRDVQECLAPRGISPPVDEIRQEPARPLDPVEPFNREARCFDLSTQLLGLMEVGSREILQPVSGIPVLPLSHVTLNNSRENRIAQQVA